MSILAMMAFKIASEWDQSCTHFSGVGAPVSWECLSSNSDERSHSKMHNWYNCVTIAILIRHEIKSISNVRRQMQTSFTVPGGVCWCLTGNILTRSEPVRFLPDMK